MRSAFSRLPLFSLVRRAAPVALTTALGLVAAGAVSSACSSADAPPPSDTPDATGTPSPNGGSSATADAATEASPDATTTHDASDGGRTPETSTPETSTPEASTDAGGTVQLRVLAMNDFHGNILPPTGNNANVLARPNDPAVGDAGTPVGDAGLVTIKTGGAAYLATHLTRLAQGAPNTVIVHAGDLTGATPLESAAFHDEPSVLVMNAMGLAFNGVGNHEFDHGTAELKRLQNGGCFPGDACDAGAFPGATFHYLAANVSLQSGGTLFPAYELRDVGGEKVAFVGMTLKDTPSIVSASAVSGLSFGEEIATVNALVPELRAKGAAAIVVLLHQGGFPSTDTTYDGCNLSETPPDGGTTDIIVEIARGLDPAVDALVTAHTHRAYDCELFGKLVTSAASYGRVVTAIDLSIDRATHRVSHKSAVNVPVTRDVPKNPSVDAIVSQYAAATAVRAGRVIGKIDADLLALPAPTGESNFGDLIADAMLAATKSPTTGGAVIAFMNTGGIRADIRVAPLGSEPPGTVTFGKAFTAQPFGNILQTVTLTGQQIKDALEQQFTGRVSAPKILQISSGFAFAYDTAKPDGQRIVSVTLGGAPLVMSQSYRVTMSDFVGNGGDGYTALKAGTNKLVGTSDVDALERYFTSFLPAAAPVATPNAGRITNATVTGP